MKPNFTYKKSTITFLLLAFFVFAGNAYSQFDAQHPDLRLCGYQCTANNVSVENVYLSATVDGVPLESVVPSCTPGTPYNVTIWMNYSQNANGDVPMTRLFATLKIGTNVAQDINKYIGTLPSTKNKPNGKIQVTTIPITWLCGQTLSFSNILVVLDAKIAITDKDTPYDCSSYSRSQCEYGTSTTFAAPLAVQYDFKPCVTETTNNVSFTSTTNGGTAPYSYLWTFSNGGTSTLANPTHSYSTTTTNTATLKVTDAKTVNNTATQTINTPAQLTATFTKSNVSCSGLNDGSATITPSGGTAPYTYSWNTSPVKTGATANGLAAGNYVCTVIDSNLCMTTVNVTINASTPMVLGTSSKTDASCFGTSTGSVTAGTVTGAVGTLIYSWKNASNTEVGTTASISNLPAGTYTVTVTDNCSSQSNSVTIGQPAAALAIGTSSKTDASCFGTSTGSVTAGTVTGAVGTLNYSWKNASNTEVGTTASISNLPAGTYTVTVTDNCSSKSNSVTIGQPAAALAIGTSSKTDASCFGTSTGSVTAGTVTGAVGTLNYSWKNASNTEVGTTAAISNLPAGTYTVTVTDNCSSKSNSVTIGQPAAALAIGTSSKTDASCFGTSTGSVTAGTVTGAVGTLIYSWKNAADAVVGTTAAISNLPAGTYTVTVTDNCSSQSNSVTIGQPAAALAIGTSSKTDASCFGTSTGSVTAGTVTGAVGTLNYSWENASNTEVGTTAAISNLPAGTYTVTVTDNCSSQSNSVTIGQPAAALAIGTSSKTDASCFGTSTGSVTAGTVTGAVGTLIYSWKNASNTEVGTTAAISNLPAGTYTVTVTDNCSSQSNSVTIGQPAAALAIGTSSKTDASCFGTSTGSVTAGTVTGAVGTLNYSWKNAADAVVGTTASISNLPAGTYTVTVTDNCSSKSNSVTIGQPAAALAIGTSSKTDASCFGTSTGSVTAGTVTGAVGTLNYSWENASNTEVGTTAAISNLPAGTYTVTVTDNCSSKSNSVTIGQPAAALAIGTSSKTDASCFGTSTGSVTAGTVTGAVGTLNYSWKNAADAVVGTTASTSNLPAGTYTVTVTDNCSSQSNSVTIGQPNLLVASSIYSTINCEGGTTTVVVSATGGTESYIGTGTFTVSAGPYSYTVTDANGCTATTTGTIADGDGTPPMISELPTSTTINCPALPSFVTPTATDSVDPSPNLTSADVTTNGTCAGSYSVTRTWTATDACGNAATASQTINVQDITAPVIAALPATSTINCPATPVFAVATATDACGSDFTLTSADVTTNGTCAGSYSVTRTWTATDACGNAATASQTINVQDITAPVIAALPATSTINCPATPVFAVATATDACGSDFTLTSADVTTNGTCAGSYSVTRTWTATDACGNAATASQTINVQDITAPVIAALPATSTINCPATPVFAVATATDACGSAFTLTSADVTTNGTCAGSYSVTRTWTATDACGNAATASQTINVQDITAPVIAALPATSTINCPATPVFAVATATDACGSDFTLTSADVTTNGTCAGSYSVTRTWTATDACGNAATASQTINVQDITAPVIAALPATSTINCPATPVFAVATATDACGSDFTLTSADVTTNGTCAGSYSVTRTWTATDACGNAATASQTINVQDITAPVIAALPATSTINCPATPVFAVATATDACGSDFTLTSADVTTNGTCAGSYSVTRTWTATDACGNAATASQTINVQDITAPVIAALPATSTINCPATPVFAVATATDACGSAFTLTSADVTTNGTCAGSYSVTRTWTATDACGNAATASQTINVQDITAPVIAALPATSTINCPATPVFAVATATDACGSAFTLTSADVTTNGTCAGSYSVTRTWTATDACGNAATASQTINVQDITAPVIAALPATSTINCPATPVFAVATATDACGSAFTLTSADVTTNGTCAGSYSVTRTWTATDACGNAATASQTINVQDITAPVIAALPATSTINCPATPVFAVATATDACGSDFTLTSADVTTNGTCAGSYSVTRTWTATDACGNAATASQTINVRDTKAPTTTTQFAAEINVNCNAIPVKPNLVFVDECSTIVPTVVYTENTINNTATSYSIIRKWIVKDACGNTSEFIQKVNVDVTATNIAIAEVKSYNIDDVPAPTINLFSLLPQGTPTGGTWFSENSSVTLNGDIVDNSSVSAGDYKFTYTINANACPTVYALTINIDGGLVLPCGTVTVHNAFSPNGDGINEIFTIDSIDDTICYPENTVEIYNRWGVLVFETKGYNNSSNAFNGTSRGRTTISQSSGLPTGTYFYILNYTSVDGNGKIQTNTKDGYLYLTK